jgi:hypothetical protein
VYNIFVGYAVAAYLLLPSISGGRVEVRCFSETPRSGMGGRTRESSSFKGEVDVKGAFH